MDFKVKSAIVTSILSGLLVFFGSFVDGAISWQGVVAAFAASAIVAITKLRDFWTGYTPTERRELFNFI